MTSSELETSIAQTPFAPAAAFIVPISVSILNAMQPPIIIALGKFERWDDPGFQVKSVVWRLFLGKLLNVLLQVHPEQPRAVCAGVHAAESVLACCTCLSVQVMTFSLLADPYLLRGQTYGFGAASVLTARVSAEKKFQYSSFQCRADQVGRHCLATTPLILRLTLPFILRFARCRLVLVSSSSSWPSL